MGIPLDIFSLYLLQGEETNCRHYLLLRVGQSAFSNADEGDYTRAVEMAEQKRSALVEAYQAELLTAECAGRHGFELTGSCRRIPSESNCPASAEASTSIYG